MRFEVYGYFVGSPEIGSGTSAQNQPRGISHCNFSNAAALKAEGTRKDGRTAGGGRPRASSLPPACEPP